MAYLTCNGCWAYWMTLTAWLHEAAERDRLPSPASQVLHLSAQSLHCALTEASGCFCCPDECFMTAQKMPWGRFAKFVRRTSTPQDDFLRGGDLIPRIWSWPSAHADSRGGLGVFGRLWKLPAIKVASRVCLTGSGWRLCWHQQR